MITRWRLLLSSLWYHRAVNAAVVVGVAVAVAVLAGALLVGASVRESLREIALRRLGATDLVVSSASFFRSTLASEVGSDPDVAAAFRAVTPLIALDGAVVHEDSQRVAARVQVFGVDHRFGAFHSNDAFAITGRDALLSPALAAELGAAVNDSLILRVAKPTDIPLGALQGRREEAGERIRLVVKTVLDASALGDFSLMPAQGATLSLFVPIERLQRDLALGDRVNAMLMAAQTAPDDARATLVERGRSAIKKHLRLDDLGLLVRPSQDQRAIVLESRAGVIQPAVADRGATVAKALGTSVQPTLAYLANTVRSGTREIPYSLVVAIDLPSAEAEASALRTLGQAPVTPRTEGLGFSPGQDPIYLNEWAAADLDAKPGDEVALDYYLWSDETGLSTGSARFTLSGIVPMSGLGGDRTLVPEYPGITDAGDVSTWDPPFPVDLTRVRPKDEQYWDDWRTAPKAFVPLEAGQRLWPSPFGSMSSLRFTVPQDVDAQQLATRATTALVSSIDPFTSGIAIRDARADALSSATGTTDFGEYFTYFSFFLLIAGVLLAGMFFAMGVEQRTREIGLLGALGFPPRAVRSALLREALILTAVGSVLGAIAAIGYAALIMYGLRTWWVGAVGTTALELHVSPLMLAAGTVGAFVAAIAALRLSLRRLLRRSPRDLLTGDAASPIDQRSSSRATMRAWVAVAFGAIAIGFAAASTFGVMGQVAGFFASGGLLLMAGLTAYSAWLWMPSPQASATSVTELGMQYSRWRPGRSVLSAALIAFACFVLVAVGAFRRDHVGASLARDAGTGGFALMAESVAPLMYDPNTPDGREDLGLPADSPTFANTDVSRFRLRPGDEVSCLTLYRPTSPRIIAPEPRFIDERRFSFAASLASTPEERANPWLLLDRRFDDGAIAAVVDQTSLMYVFHLALGDDFSFTPEGQPPVRLRIVGALADSVLQSEMIISEDAFIRLFPRHEGYRLWFIQTPPGNVQALATDLERSLSDFGVDTTDTRVRLASYHQVENTYLSTFQTLGGLGLLVGTLGLAAVLARNVLERRRELGLLGAVGFEPRHLRTIVLAESGLLVGGGLVLGTVSALVAVWPALIERAQTLPYASLGFMLVAVAVTGLAAAAVAVRIATAMSITEAVKSE